MTKEQSEWTLKSKLQECPEDSEFTAQIPLVFSLTAFKKSPFRKLNLATVGEDDLKEEYSRTSPTNKKQVSENPYNSMSNSYSCTIDRNLLRFRGNQQRGQISGDPTELTSLPNSMQMTFNNTTKNPVNNTDTQTQNLNEEEEYIALQKILAAKNKHLGIPSRENSFSPRKPPAFWKSGQNPLNENGLNLQAATETGLNMLEEESIESSINSFH